jgi:hypothetical protein
MSYPENNITFYYGENKLGFLKDEAVQKFLTSEELEELEDTGYLDVDQRFGEALKKYVKTGEFELRKPIRRLQTVKYVRESLNESTMNLSKKIREQDFENMSQEEKDRILTVVSIYGYANTVKKLLDAGADVHTDNDIALRLASRYGHLEVVKILLDAGADVHAKDNEALRWAKYKGHTEIVELLKQYMKTNESFKSIKDYDDEDDIANYSAKHRLENIKEEVKDVIREYFENFIHKGEFDEESYEDSAMEGELLETINDELFDDDERIEAEDDEAQEYIDELASEVLDEDIEGFDLIRDYLEQEYEDDD